MDDHLRGETIQVVLYHRLWFGFNSNGDILGCVPKKARVCSAIAIWSNWSKNLRKCSAAPII